jgi:hypothetical protein
VANEPFLFHTNEGDKYFTGVMAWSLKGLEAALRKVNVKSVEFHNTRGDLEKWAEKSLQDQALAGQLKKIKASKLKGESLRNALIEAVKDRYHELNRQAQAVTRYF